MGQRKGVPCYEQIVQQEVRKAGASASALVHGIGRNVYERGNKNGLLLTRKAMIRLELSLDLDGQ